MAEIFMASYTTPWDTIGSHGHLVQMQSIR